jgi:hypothetical protein
MGSERGGEGSEKVRVPDGHDAGGKTRRKKANGSGGDVFEGGI